MGKGARNRAKKKAKAERALARGAASSPAAQNVPPGRDRIQRLLAVTDLTSFLRLRDQDPRAVGDEALAILEDFESRPAFRTSFGSWAELLRQAREDPEGAWKAFEERRVELDRLAEPLTHWETEFETAFADGHFALGVEIATKIIERATAAGLAMIVRDGHHARAKSLINVYEGDRLLAVEMAIEDLDAALGLSPEPAAQGEILMHLGIAFLERHIGDRADNNEASVLATRDAFELVRHHCSSEVEAMCRTNLANALHRTERGDRLENLKEAERLCQRALRYRTPQRNAYDWGHTQITLGAVKQDLELLDKAPSTDIDSVYQAVIDQSEALDGSWIIGAAHAELGRYMARTAHPTLAQRVEVWADGRDEDFPDPTPRLEAARETLLEGRNLTATGPHRHTYGRLLGDLSSVYMDLDETDKAIEAARESLQILRPDSSPRDCSKVAAALGAVLVDRGEWHEAADAFRTAVEAAEISFHSRLENAGRAAELRRAPNLTRWAAFAIERSGSPIEAALVLEAGRTRELRRRLGVGSVAADSLPNHLEAAYEEAAQALSRSALDPDDSPESRAFQEVMSEIRSQRGFERFGVEPIETDLAAAIEPGWPLVFVNPTPSGTLVISLTSRSGELEARSDVVPTTSTQVFFRLLVGNHAVDAAELAGPSYFLEAGGMGNETTDLQDALDESLPWLGAHIARPLHDFLAQDGETIGITLISCGPIGAAPLHAAPWDVGEGEKCLLDYFPVRFAPSATAVSACLARERAIPSEHALIALSDPLDDLPAAAPEVEAIQAKFGGSALIAAGSDATSAFLRANAQLGTHIHLACHAQAGLLSSDETGIHLADGFFEAQHLTTLGPMNSRLVVVSACQSAVANIAELPDEAFSIGTAFLGAGTACAIASLWPVEDGATALLMIRLYEELLEGSQRPPEALRKAQLWLRDLTTAERDEALAEHPSLEAEFVRRGDNGPHYGQTGSRNAVAESTPYSHPDYWASFVAVGV